MNVVLWIFQVLLALVFLASGLFKLVTPREALVEKLPVLAAYRPLSVTLVALAEVLGAIGVIAPLATGVAPGLTPWAALGLATVMVAAAVAHAEQADYKPLALHAVLLAMAVAVVYGRSAGLPV